MCPVYRGGTDGDVDGRMNAGGRAKSARAERSGVRVRGNLKPCGSHAKLPVGVKRSVSVRIGKVQ